MAAADFSHHTGEKSSSKKWGLSIAPLFSVICDIFLFFSSGIAIFAFHLFFVGLVQ